MQIFHALHRLRDFDPFFLAGAREWQRHGTSLCVPNFDSLPASLDSACDFTNGTLRLDHWHESGVDEGPRPGPSCSSIKTSTLAGILVSHRGDVLSSRLFHARFTSATPQRHRTHTNGQPRRLLILAYARKAITIFVLARRNNTLTVALSNTKKTQ